MCNIVLGRSYCTGDTVRTLPSMLAGRVGQRVTYITLACFTYSRYAEMICIIVRVVTVTITAHPSP